MKSDFYDLLEDWLGKEFVTSDGEKWFKRLKILSNSSLQDIDNIYHKKKKRFQKGKGNFIKIIRLEKRELIYKLRSLFSF